MGGPLIYAGRPIWVKIYPSTAEVKGMWRFLYLLIWIGLGAIALFGCASEPRPSDTPSAVYKVKIVDR